MKKKLSKKDELLIAGIIGLVVVLFLYIFFIVRPLVKRILEYNVQEKEINVQLRNAENMAEDKERLEKEVARIKASIEYFEKKLPQSVDTPQILDELIEIGKVNDITFISIEPQQIQRISVGESGKLYSELPIELKLKAGYHEFAKFVNDIENFQRFMKVDEIQITADERDHKKHNIRLTVSTVTIQLKEGN